jgi:O-antigen/teichoic acid export membrane protein
VEDRTTTGSGALGVVDPLDAESAGATAVRGSALRAGGYAAGMLLSLVSAPLLVRHLGVADYGVYITITSLVTIVAGISDLGLTSLGVREWARRGAHHRGSLMRDMLGARLGFTLVGIGGAIAFALLAGYGSRRLLGTGLACIGLMLLGLQSALTIPLIGRLRQGWVAGAELVRQVVQVGLIIGFVVAGLGLVPMLATAIPAALASLLLTATVARDSIVLPSIHPRRWLGLLRGSVPFAAASAVSVVYLRTTIIVTSLVATAGQNGQFAISFRVLEVVISVPSLLVGALFPVFARAALTDRARMRSSMRRTLRAVWGAGAIVAVSMAVGAPFVVTVLAGSRPHGAVVALRILGGGLGFSFLGSACQYALLAVRAHRSILLINVCALVLNAVLTVVLANAYGSIGAAIALAACELTVAAAARIMLARRVGRLSIGSDAYVRVLLTVAVGVIAAIALSGIGPVPSAIVAAALAVAVGLGVGAVPRELIAILISGRRTSR